MQAQIPAYEYFCIWTYNEKKDHLVMPKAHLQADKNYPIHNLM